jgi:hypothetical protein
MPKKYIQRYFKVHNRLFGLFHHPWSASDSNPGPAPLRHYISHLRCKFSELVLLQNIIFPPLFRILLMAARMFYQPFGLFLFRASPWYFIKRLIVHISLNRLENRVWSSDLSKIILLRSMTQPSRTAIGAPSRDFSFDHGFRSYILHSRL